MKKRIDMAAVKTKLDANETIFFARELESIEAKQYEVFEKKLKYRELLPVDNTADHGADSITYKILTKVGMAKVIANYATDLPRADVFMQEYTQPVKSIGISYGYNVQEIKAASMANRPLDSMKAQAGTLAVAQKENEIAWTGDTKSGLLGLFDNPNIPTIAAPNGAGGTSPWSAKTSAEIIADIRSMVTGIRTQSKSVFEDGFTLLLPIAQKDIIDMKLVTEGDSSRTISEHILEKSSFGIVEIASLPDELDNVATGGTEDAAFLYAKDPMVLSVRIPMELQMLSPEARGLEIVRAGYSRFGGVVVRYPIATTFLTGI